MAWCMFLVEFYVIYSIEPNMKNHLAQQIFKLSEIRQFNLNN